MQARLTLPACGLARFPVTTTKLEDRVTAIISLRETLERMSARTKNGTAGELPGVSDSVDLLREYIGRRLWGKAPDVAIKPVQMDEALIGMWTMIFVVALRYTHAWEDAADRGEHGRNKEATDDQRLESCNMELANKIHCQQTSIHGSKFTGSE